MSRSKLEKADLIPEVIAQIAGGDCDRLEVLALLVLFAATAGGVEAVEQDLFPIYLAGALILGFRLRRLGGFALLLLLFLLLSLDEIEEWIVEKFLLEVLLEVQQRHVEQVHRLIEAWIDLELLTELGRLIKTRLQEAATSSLLRANLSRSRAVSVGPR